MDVQVTIKISKEALGELTEVFREAIFKTTNVSAMQAPGQAIERPIVPAQQAVPVTQPTQMQAQTPQSLQLPVSAITGREPEQQTAPITTHTQEPAQIQQPAPVQTTQHTYTLDDLASAAMILMDKGLQAQLQDLLAGYGVEALPQLPQEQYGNFATALRGMGAQI